MASVQELGKRIADISQAAREMCAQADEVLGVSISNLCFEGTEEELGDTINTQPAMLTTSLAHFAYLRERLQEISRADILAELGPPPLDGDKAVDSFLSATFAALWNSIHKKAGTRWEDCPEVWVLEFELVE